MSDCSETCGGGKQYRYPILTRAPDIGGTRCPDYIVNNITEKYPCNNQPCPGTLSQSHNDNDKDMEMSGQKPYIYEKYIVQTLYLCGFIFTPLIFVQLCTKYCSCEQLLGSYSITAVDCRWRWSRFSDCRARCVDGHSFGRERYPIIVRQPLYGGTLCPDHVQNNQSEVMKCRDEDCSGQSYIHIHLCS